jgi:ribosome-associated protein
MTSEQLRDNIVASMEEGKAVEINVIDIQGKTSLADYLIICSGTSDVHVKAITERVQRDLKDAKVRHIGLEGLPQATWVLLDFGDVIVHVMQADQRQYYGLEQFWSRMPMIEEMRAEP